MTIYLTIWDDFNGKKVGVLEIRHNIISEQVIQTYEFIGAGSSDGGTWGWVMGSKAVEAHLTSNIRKSKVAILRSTRWGKNNPPAEPWFQDPTGIDGNTLIYFMVNGSTRSCIWALKK